MNEEHFFSSKIFDGFDPFIANNQELFEMSLKFANGDDTEVDFVAAHVCLNLAALRGCKESAEYRKELAFDMNAEDTSKAQKEARNLIALIKKRESN
jgi:hypothetical protein